MIITIRTTMMTMTINNNTNTYINTGNHDWQMAGLEIHHVLSPWHNKLANTRLTSTAAQLHRDAQMSVSKIIIFLMTICCEFIQVAAELHSVHLTVCLYLDFRLRVQRAKDLVNALQNNGPQAKSLSLPDKHAVLFSFLGLRLRNQNCH